MLKFRFFLVSIIFLFTYSDSLCQQPKLMLPIGKYILAASLTNAGKQLATISKDNKLKIWDLSDFKLQENFSDSDLAKSFNCNFSKTGRYLAVSCTNFTTKIFDIKKGKFLYNLNGWVQDLNSFAYSTDEKFIITSNDKYGGASVWDLMTGKRVIELQQKGRVDFSIFSPDGRYIFTGSDEGEFKIWDSTGKNVIGEGGKPGSGVFCALFDQSANYLFVGYSNGSLHLFNIKTGQLLMETNQGRAINDICVNKDGKFFATASDDSTIDIWEKESGKLYDIIHSHKGSVLRIVFGNNDSTIISASADQTIQKNNFRNNTTLLTKNINQGFGTFSQKAERLVTCNDDKIDLYSYPSLDLIYSVLPLENNNYLIIDSLGRYDGSESSRKQIKLSCGTETISLDQVKDKLWVPNLAERIMNGDSINAPKLSDLHICGLIPEVETEDTTNNKYHFKITPRSGGLGETVLYVNGNETKHYQPSELSKTKDGYELVVNKDELKDYFVSGQENPVTVKCYIASNDISSRGVTVIAKPESKNVVNPNFYAVMVGVSDYKGDGLDLKYAAKDAGDLSKAVEAAAKKWLDKDGKEHVFMYDLTTDKEHYLLPEKNAIIKTLKEIGEKATANDILLVFFAGHGVTQGEDKKQFYFLTADASEATATGAAVKDVGISSSELINWLQPSNIKAQKRILILDACNSGQAINDIADNNNLAVRNTDDAEQIKSIDKLNERSGLFILAASASNQSAYEMSRYSQGILTYSLLKAMKENPSILEDNKYLNLSRWFNAAENTVNDLVKETGARQQPQIMSNTNFNIGIVDADVMSSIVLPNEKPLFTNTNLQNNDENIAADNLDLSKKINNNLSSISARDIDNTITFVPATNNADAYSINGRYDVNGNNITVKINIRQHNETKDRFELSGTKDKLDELANEIVQQALQRIEGKK